MVAGDHDGPNARGHTGRHGVSCLWTRRVENPHQPDEREVFLDVVVGPVIGEPIEQAEPDAEHPHPVAGEAVIRAHDSGRPLLIEPLASLAHPHVSRYADELIDATFRKCDVTKR